MHAPVSREKAYSPREYGLIKSGEVTKARLLKERRIRELIQEQGIRVGDTVSITRFLRGALQPDPVIGEVTRFRKGKVSGRKQIIRLAVDHQPPMRLRAINTIEKL